MSKKLPGWAKTKYASCEIKFYMLSVISQTFAQGFLISCSFIIYALYYEVEGNMKYQTEVIIGLPRERVVELFDSIENLKKWQPDLLRLDHLEGSPGKAGAKSNLVYETKKGERVMEEEIIENNLPESMHFIYRLGSVENRNMNFFSSTADGNTLWRQDNEFNMKGFMACLGFFAPGMFRKETLRSMKAFKDFAEGQGA